MMFKASLTFKVPAVAAIFLVVASIFISQQVLSRLQDIQSSHLETLAGVHLDGLAASLMDAVLREDIWEVFAILDRTRQGKEGLRALETTVVNQDGQVIAATDPKRVASGAALPAEYAPIDRDASLFLIDETEARAFARRDILYNDQKIGSVYSKLDIAPLIRERRHVLWTLILSNAVLTLLMLAAVWISVRRMLRPVGVLAAHLEESAEASISPISKEEVDKAGVEFQRLYAAFNSMALGLAEREELVRKLAEEERLASLGRLASGMAHEINNPLGGLFNALDTLKHHGDRAEVRARATNLIDRGLRGIRDIVKSALMTWRADKDGRLLEPHDIDDLRILASPELNRNELELVWSVGLDRAINLPASSIRQILLNLFLNACQVSERGGRVEVAIREEGDFLTIGVEDSGLGMPEFAVRILTSDSAAPSPLATGHGLGLWMTRRLIDELGGSAAVSSNEKGGSRVYVVIPVPVGGMERNAA